MQRPLAPLDIDLHRTVEVTVGILLILLHMDYPMEMETGTRHTTVPTHTSMDKTLGKTEHILATPRQPEPGTYLVVPEGWESMTENRCRGLGSRMRMVDTDGGVDSGVRFVVGHDLSIFIFQAYRIRITE